MTKSTMIKEMIMQLLSDGSPKPEPESLETEMMKILMPELMRNPDAADALLRLSGKFR